MKLIRLGAGAALSLVLLTSWMGACSVNNDESCGLHGERNGICRSAPTCPSGTDEINIVDPADECPPTYLCCAPSSTTTSTTATTTTDSGSPAAADTGTSTVVDSGPSTKDAGTTTDTGTSTAVDAATQG